MGHTPRVFLTIGGSLVGALLSAFAEVMAIGFIGGDVEGTGLVAIGLAPFAALLGGLLAGVILWKSTRPKDET